MKNRQLGMVIAVGAAVASAACGSSEPTGPEASGPAIERVWQRSAADVERTVQLRPDGSAASVEARFAARTCTASGGTWSADAGVLTLELAPPGGVPATETVGFEVFADSLVLGSGASVETYRPAPFLPDCGAYDFRRWTGTLSAEVDSVPRSFGNVSVTAALSAGLLEIRACPTAGPSCTVSDAELILKIDAPPGPLGAGTYPIQNIAIGQPNFFALIDPFPADSSFPGFNTERLEPPGVFELTSVSDTLVVGSFEFRANEISEGLSAPDGRRFVLVTSGVVTLELR